MRSTAIPRRSRRRQEAGYVTIMISIMIPAIFIGLAATAVDTARWYLEGERVQKAADAAALAGVPFLPFDLASARARALEVAKRNGYDDALPEVEVTAEFGARTSQLRVTISSNIDNEFGRIIGVGNTTINKTAVADFTGPAPMGSPCNTFGTEPPSGSGGAAPVGSAIGAVRPPNCPQNPMLWATVEGPHTGKVQGDRYGTRWCETAGTDECDGDNNREYTSPGYFWLIKVQPRMVGRPVNLQLYDPAFVLTGQFCDSNSGSSSTDQLPSASTLDNDMNPFVRTDGKVRYANIDSLSSRPTVPYCTGDSFPGSRPSGTTAMTTTFLVREQTDTQDPLQAPVIDQCVKQYGAFTSYPTYNNLKSGRSGYNAELAQVFHNWDSLCTFTPQRSGDYYLQVRTNKHHGFASGDLFRDVPTGSISSVAGDQGDANPAGGGSNSFAIRAVTAPGFERDVAVSGWDRMPIYANSDAAQSIFPLIRVLPGAAGQKISFEFFDAGDAATAGTVRVLMPTDARTPTGGMITVPFPGGCTSTGGSAGAGQNLINCQANLTRSGSVSRNNGKIQKIVIPIPPDYSCDATVFTNCWYQVQIGFGTGDVHDVTTWDAEIVGDPVRLIE